MEQSSKFNIIRSLILSSCIPMSDKTELCNFIDDIEERLEEEDDLDEDY